ncbi:MAG: ATP-dependent DNA helicase [Gammaproteobacteria bacterium]
MIKIRLSLSDFALPMPMLGSIDSYSGFGNDAANGLKLHKIVQESRAITSKDYQAEVSIEHTFTTDKYMFTVSGRMDGFYAEKNKIEEIKSSFNIFELSQRIKADNEHPYCLQLRTYGYFHYLAQGKKPSLNMHLISSRNEESLDCKVHLNLAGYQIWLDKRLEALCEEADIAVKRVNYRKEVAQKFSFPFPTIRKGQQELIQTIEDGIKLNKPLLLQAGTGLGKTMGVTFPILKESFSRGQNTIYLTPKNSQHSVAEDAVQKIQDHGFKIKSLTVTAKQKLCLKNEPFCNPSYCEYAKDHYTKVHTNKLIPALRKKKKLNAQVFLELGKDHQVCPYELQFALLKEMDFIICDYNYAFAPRASIGRITKSILGVEGKPNLVIDEIHNLPQRAMDYYSPALSLAVLKKMQGSIEKVNKEYQSKFDDLLKECLYTIEKCAPKNASTALVIKPPINSFIRVDSKIREVLSSYLKSNITIEKDDLMMKLANYWSEFTSSLEHISDNNDIFFTSYTPNTGTIKITCCDASDFIKDSYEDYAQIVGFSATIKPFDYYIKLLGLDKKELITAEFNSPFSADQRKLLIIPQVSTKYSDRTKNYPRVADVINKICQLKNGNYIAFFPSFEFLNRTVEKFECPPGFYLSHQTKHMLKIDVDRILENFKRPLQRNILFAVQGGMFSEGLDYPGDMLIGAFVVGPPLPMFDLEREKMKSFYETKYKAGFDYAYTYPAMTKAVQAAGRVIRTETDKGIIVLLDDRFLHPNYTKCMPKDWIESGETLVSSSILKDVADFWEK